MPSSRDDPLSGGDMPPPAVPSKTTGASSGGGGGMAGKFANAFRRQTAEEKEAKRREKSRKNGDLSRSKTLGGSSRMDVIDKLDLSGIHGSSSE